MQVFLDQFNVSGGSVVFVNCMSDQMIGAMERIHHGKQLKWNLTNNCNRDFGRLWALASDNGPSGGRHVANGERTATASAKPPTQGEQAQGEPAQGEHVQRETSSTWSVLPARYSKVFRKAA